MAAVRRVLVVCTANQCRSPMAEGLIRARLADEGRAADVIVTSAGTWAQGGVAATGHAVSVMAERGIDVSEHRSREVDDQQVDEADLVLVMTAGHREALTTEYPAARQRIRLLSSLAGGAWDIADPVGHPLEDYRTTANELARLIDAGWPEIIGSDPRDG